MKYLSAFVTLLLALAVANGQSENSNTNKISVGKPGGGDAAAAK